MKTIKCLYNYYKACRMFGCSIKYSLSLIIFNKNIIIKNNELSNNYVSDLIKFGVRLK